MLSDPGDISLLFDNLHAKLEAQFDQIYQNHEKEELSREIEYILDQKSGTTFNPCCTCSEVLDSSIHHYLGQDKLHTTKNTSRKTDVEYPTPNRRVIADGFSTSLLEKELDLLIQSVGETVPPSDESTMTCNLTLDAAELLPLSLQSSLPPAQESFSTLDSIYAPALSLNRCSNSDINEFPYHPNCRVGLETHSLNNNSQSLATSPVPSLSHLTSKFSSISADIRMMKLELDQLQLDSISSSHKLIESSKSNKASASVESSRFAKSVKKLNTQTRDFAKDTAPISTQLNKPYKHCEKSKTPYIKLTGKLINPSSSYNRSSLPPRPSLSHSHTPKSASLSSTDYASRKLEIFNHLKTSLTKMSDTTSKPSKKDLKRESGKKVDRQSKNLTRMHTRSNAFSDRELKGRIKTTDRNQQSKDIVSVNPSSGVENNHGSGTRISRNTGSKKMEGSKDSKLQSYRFARQTASSKAKSVNSISNVNAELKKKCSCRFRVSK
ncbi:hypothetical protein BKA69DRAFT_1120993 [Paraphysoderma sedebokerense]|nr:hypothetical protein BKA69DRAFT_1120993 [Paraphysoderma sedebokerense]